MGFVYKKGMGGSAASPTEKIGCLQTKRLLSHQGYTCNLTVPAIGDLADRRIREFQADVWGKDSKEVDGAVGVNTMRQLVTPVYRTTCVVVSIEDSRDWLGCQMGWESGLDPASTYVNSDGSLDRGLYQFNDERTVLTDDQAYDPLYVIPYRLRQARLFRDRVAADCDKNKLDAWMIAASANRAPSGAIYWSQHPETKPVDHRGDTNLTTKEWAEFCAFYITRVDAGGREVWTGKKA